MATGMVHIMDMQNITDTRSIMGIMSTDRITGTRNILGTTSTGRITGTRNIMGTTGITNIICMIKDTISCGVIPRTIRQMRKLQTYRE